MSSEKILNVTKISSIIKCSREYFEGTVFKDSLTEYQLFIVESPSNSTLEVYYGSRKLKDFIVVDSYPSGRDYPNNKLYIRTSPDRVVRDLLYKTSRGKLINLSDQILIKEVSRDRSSLEVVWRDDIVTSLSVVSIDGQSTPIVTSVINNVVSQIQDDHTVKWERI